jgi:hypothetical protein
MQVTDPKKQFAETLFGLHPDFIPTQALYLDLEGRQNGSEDILSLYWPILPGSQRFSWIKKTESSQMDLAELDAHLHSIGATGAKWIVVYSAGQTLPNERERLVDLLGRDPFPDSDWINLLHVVQQCRPIRRSITEHRNVWYRTDKTQTRNSLEALEWEFGIERPVNLRSHSYRYRDLDGERGLMEVLAITQQSINGSASGEDERSLRAYCEEDVKNMYEIAYGSEKLLFSQSERRRRRQTNP